MEGAIAVLEAQGAVVVDPADVPTYATTDPDSNFAAWGFCLGAHQAKGADEDCSVNFKYGAKRDFNAWLASLGPGAPVRTLAELREWNIEHARGGALKYAQARFDISDEMDVEADRARNETDMARDELLSRTRGIDAVLAEHDLDAILTPGSRGAGLAARSGTPIIVVPLRLRAERADAAVPRRGSTPAPRPSASASREPIAANPA